MPYAVEKTLKISFRSYWRIATGASQAAGLDILCARDHEGLPYVPGRHLKGMLRDALWQAKELGCVSISPDAMFGSRDARGDDSSEKGVVRVSSARLPKVERSAIAALDTGVLFHVRNKTAIDRATCAASPMSLRSEEVAVPLELQAMIEGTTKDVDALITVLPLIRRLGNGRTRGLGRCVIRVED